MHFGAVGAMRNAFRIQRKKTSLNCVPAHVINGCQQPTLPANLVDRQRIPGSLIGEACVLNRFDTWLAPFLSPPRRTARRGHPTLRTPWLKHFPDTGIASLGRRAADFIPCCFHARTSLNPGRKPQWTPPRPLGADRNTALGARGRLFFSVGGRDDDPRPLCAIAEFQRFRGRCWISGQHSVGFVCSSADPPDGIDVARIPSSRKACDSAALQWFAAGGCSPVRCHAGHSRRPRRSHARHRYALIQGCWPLLSS